MDESKQSEFYSKLRKSHLLSEFDEIPPTNIQHTFLNPILRPYQENAVKWMIRREITPDYFTSDCINVDDDIRIPSGGILADEMGLGKTVEILALILANKKKKRKLDEIEILPVKKTVSKTATFLCVCNKPEGKKLIIVCSKCNKSQHKECVAKYRLDDTQIYMCPKCWSKEKSIIESSATIIISPTAIKDQWESEISKHINDKRFKVFIYNGVSKTGWISPKELAEYDVVLTDYNILRSEVHYLNTNSWHGSLRHKKKYIPIVSPLNYINWWRVCLDEAQLVESTIGNACKMVKILPTVHRWAVTGTPMEKSFDDLFGLLFFMDCKPYTENNYWKSLTTPIHLEGDYHPLFNVLKKIMWRTCKSGVLDQINIPPQTEEIIYVTMSDVETFFYQSENVECSEAFNKKIVLEKSILLSELSQRTLKVVMEAFRKLRQDCTVPTTFRKNDQSTVKKILNPSQLLEHLVSTNEIECKQYLRSLISSLNGIAALHIIREEYEEGIKVYKTVLRWAKDYSETNLSVDTLLQIHAIHNLLDIFEIQGVEIEIESYQQDLVKLESKYMKSYADIVTKAKEELDKIVDSITEISGQLTKDHHWFRDIIYEKKNSVDYFDKIKNYVEDNYGRDIVEKGLTVHTIDYLITAWLQKIETERKKMKNKFEKLKYFSDNIKPKHEQDRSQSDKIEMLVKSAFQCHLNPETMNNSNKIDCELCQIKQSMKVYESIIFSKTLNLKNVELENVGTWKVSYFEWMLKWIHSTFKPINEDNKLLKEGEIHLKYLSLLADEYKAFSNFYVEINYVAAAFDELNMCKLRLQDAERIDSNGGFLRLNISQIEIEWRMADFQTESNEAELNFIRMLGRIKYLKHLDNSPKEVNCPICKIQTEKRYSVLLCGHILCLTCLVTLAKMENSKSLSCCICRQKTNHKDIFYITNNGDEEDELQVQGQYSTKVRAIVRNVLKLQNEDKTVKIIIFSHWDNILDNIGMALNENNIKSTFKRGNYLKAIADFKNLNLGINCILLPLAFGAKGLNLIEATHVFLVEPIMTPSEELQAIGRVHRIGQTKPTVVHRFIVRNTIEENIFNTISNDKTGLWKLKQITIEDLNQLFTIVEQGVLYQIN